MALPEIGINAFTVADLLGYYAYKVHPVTGVSTRYIDLATLCKHPNINMWSYKKPVQDVSVIGLTEFLSTNLNCGILFAETPAHNGIGYYNTLYQKPAGGAASPYRLGDFRGYNHQALPEIYVKNIPLSANKFTSQTINSDFSNTNNVQIAFGDINFSPDTPIFYSDGTTPVQKVNELLMGCEVRQGSLVIKEVFSANSISVSKTFSLPIHDLSLGNYELAFFLFAPNLPNRRFPFPDTPAFPNHISMALTLSIPFEMTIKRYTITDINSTTTILGAGTNNITNKISSAAYAATFTASESIVLMKNSFALNLVSDIIQGNATKSVSIVSKSANVIETTDTITIPTGEWARLNIVRGITYYPQGDLFTDPYNVNFSLLYGAVEIETSSFTIQK